VIREGELVAAPVRSDVVDFHQPADTDDEQHLGPQQLAWALSGSLRWDQPVGLPRLEQLTEIVEAVMQ
jgi:hypothetical protein